MKITSRPLLTPLLLAGALLLLLAGCTALGTEPVAVSHDGLQRVEQDAFDAVYRKPGLDLSSYQQVQIETCQVSLKSNWLRDQNQRSHELNRRVTDEDVAKIKSTLAGLCNEIFTEKLTGNSHFQLVSEPGEAVLQLTPSIIDLDIQAPDVDRLGNTRTYVTSEGSMTLVLEARDAITGEILGRVVDKHKGHGQGYLTWTNAAIQKQEAKRLLRSWGDALNRMAEQAWPAP
ncbi:DUF3313 family protein [Halioxenophilus sp. WMMB6]|uniref:DUF3313 family protein n=1 Tax=Halioxenophilus sp. WMMB6 TaxID=3073815 RepID=UPI00295F03AA|nr:DUF3313 family protein [Halioxenophilus sp. WMMB6]